MTQARAVSAAWIARPVVRECHVSTPVHVDALISTGHVLQQPEAATCTPDDRPRGACWDEYFNYAMRLDDLDVFFERACPGPMRHSAYADLALLSYIRNALPTARFDPSGRSLG